MSWLLSISPCACIDGYDTDYVPPVFVVKDSEKVPGIDLYIVGLSLNETFWGIDQYFSTKEEFVEYLNDVFTGFAEIDGLFNQVGEFITYTNPERFKTAEIMAILGTKLLIYKFGAGNGVPIYPYTAVYTDQSSMITDSDNLIGKRILEIKVNELDIPLTSANVSQNPINKTISFTTPRPNSNVYILVSDDVPIVSSGLPYSFPFPLS